MILQGLLPVVELDNMGIVSRCGILDRFAPTAADRLVVRFCRGCLCFPEGTSYKAIDFGALAPVDKLDNIGIGGAGRYLSHV